MTTQSVTPRAPKCQAVPSSTPCRTRPSPPTAVATAMELAAARPNHVAVDGERARPLIMRDAPGCAAIVRHAHDVTGDPPAAARILDDVVEPLARAGVDDRPAHPLRAVGEV